MKNENKLLIFQLLGFLKIYRFAYLKEKTNQENRFKTTAIKKSLTYVLATLVKTLNTVEKHV